MTSVLRSVPERITGYQRVGFGKPVSFGWLSDDFATNGAIGDPTRAGAAAGRTLFEAGVAGCVESLREIATFLPS